MLRWPRRRPCLGLNQQKLLWPRFGGAFFVAGNRAGAGVTRGGGYLEAISNTYVVGFAAVGPGHHDTALASQIWPSARQLRGQFLSCPEGHHFVLKQEPEVIVNISRPCQTKKEAGHTLPSTSGKHAGSRSALPFACPHTNYIKRET